MELHVFMSDEAALNKSTTYIKHSELSQGVAYLSDNMVNYFLDPKSIQDNRTNRLTVTGMAAPLKGDMVLHYDRHRFDSNLFTGVPTNNFNILLNIIEASVYAQGLTDMDLNILFTSEVSVYGIYQPDSINRTMQASDVMLTFTNGSNTVHSVRHKVTFDVRLIPSGPIVTIVIWVGDELFKTSYPYTTITKIIPPCEPSKLLDLNFNNILDALGKSALYMNEVINAEVRDRDHNGVLIYPTGYNLSAYTTRYELPFGLLYKGPEPGSQASRIAIRDYLLGLTKTDETPLASEGVWRTLFPELFVQAQFFIVPRWNDTFSSGGLTFARSSTSHNNMLTHVQGIVNWMPTQHIVDYLEIFYTEAALYLMSIVPDMDNEHIMSFVVEHPTYMEITPTDPKFTVMEMQTQEFVIKLNAALAQLSGSANEYTFVHNTFHGRGYLSFTNNFVEYHILKPNFY